MPKPKRTYSSKLRDEGRDRTQRRILDAALAVFRERSLDAATIADVAAAAGVGTSTVYAAFKSKDGLVRRIVERALFGARFDDAVRAVASELDPVGAVAASARVARAIYDSERDELGDVRAHAAGSAALAEVDREFERIRLEMQRERVEKLLAAGAARRSLELAEARRILWMYTSRDVYRMLAIESAWGSDRYEAWLERTLLDALVDDGAAAAWRRRRARATKGPARRTPTRRAAGAR